MTETIMIDDPERYDNYFVNGSPEEIAGIRKRVIDDLQKHTGVLMRVTGTVEGRPVTREVIFTAGTAHSRNGFFSIGTIAPHDTEASIRSVPMDNGGEYLELVADLTDVDTTTSAN